MKRGAIEIYIGIFLCFLNIFKEEGSRKDVSLEPLPNEFWTYD